MVINENGLITENQETQDNNLINNQIEEIENSSINISNDSETVNINDIDNDNNDDDKTISELSTNKQLENVSDNTIKESEQKETAETNCLALTVRKNYNVSIIKNSIFTSLRLSFKVAISTLVLNILKLFL